MHHPNIVRLIGVADEQYPILVATEIMSGGTFLKFLQKRGTSFTEKQLIEMCLQVCNGMAYLEGKNRSLHSWCSKLSCQRV